MKRKFNIVFASHTYMGGTFVVGSHHLARELSQMGHRVLHLSTPITPFHIGNIKDSSVKHKFKRMISKQILKYNNNLIDVLPFSLIPWNVSKHFFRKYNINLTLNCIYPNLANLMKKFFKKEQVDILLIDQPTLVGLERILNPKIVVYRATDLYYEMTGDKDILKAEQVIISNVNAIIGTSQPVYNYLKRLNSSVPSLLLENGVEYNRFSKKQDCPKDLKEIKGSKVIYVGAIDQRFDINAVKVLSKNCPDINIIIIGPYDSNKKDELSKYKNIYLLGPRKYTDVPAYLQHSDVAILPLSDHPSNNGRSPMKLYEYGAAGLPVLTKRTEELERRREDYISLYDNYDEMTNKLNEVLKNNKEIDTKKIQLSAKKHSWEIKAAELTKFLEELG